MKRSDDIKLHCLTPLLICLYFIIRSASLVPDTQPLSVSSIPDTQPLSVSSIPDTQPLSASSIPDAQPLSTPSIPDTQPMSASSIPDTQPLSTPSIPDTQPLGTPSLPSTKPLGTPSLPDAERSYTPLEKLKPQKVPEDYLVEGLPSTEKGTKANPRKRKRDERKSRRNLGLSYESQKSVQVVNDRRTLKPPCEGNVCGKKDLSCSEFTNDIRLRILTAFWDLGDLHEQRQWITRHVKSVTNKSDDYGKPRRKQRTNTYMLPFEGGNKSVCRIMFLNTLNVSERMVKTALAKLDENGIMEMEKRGGRPESMKIKDAAKRESVQAHINRFPRMESHFCRSTSSFEYLAPDLTVAKMFELYEHEYGKTTPVTYAFYHNVFQTMKLRFHLPKKDLCGICETANNGSNNTDGFLQEYAKHIMEKDEVRAVLKACTEESAANSNVVTAIFDLEKVLYLPKSERSEIFYKRRLSCFNFTIFEAASHQGHCFFWHEGQACRGANEISSCLDKFLRLLDSRGATHVNFFSDGCAGQNKNSIVPSMYRHFLKSSTNVQRVRHYFFETNHGQSSGDSMHSVVELAMKRVPEIIVPDRLMGIIDTACKKKPYITTALSTGDILDFKSMAASSGILRVRTSDNGNTIKWTDFMELEVRKSEPWTIHFKTSHLQQEWDSLTICRRAAVNENLLNEAYKEQPKLSKGKYDDLMALCNEKTPVIRHPDHKMFYQNLPHY